MTSVLYSAGLNYQGGNPIGNQVRSVQNNVSDLRKVIDTQTAEIALLKAQHTVLDRDIKSATAALAAINTRLSALPATATPAPTPTSG
jgi:flagellar capping protein FliD